MAITPIPSEHSVLRCVPWSKLKKDEDDHVLGFEYTAFVRKNEAGLSCTWIDFFDDVSGDNITLAVQATRRNISVGGKAVFAIGNVGRIIEANKERGYKIRIVHAPEDENPAHSEVLRLTRDDIELLDYLAAEIWCEMVHNKDVPE